VGASSGVFKCRKRHASSNEHRNLALPLATAYEFQ